MWERGWQRIRVLSGKPRAAARGGGSQPATCVLSVGNKGADSDKLLYNLGYTRILSLQSAGYGNHSCIIVVQTLNPHGEPPAHFYIFIIIGIIYRFISLKMSSVRYSAVDERITLQSVREIKIEFKGTVSTRTSLVLIRGNLSCTF